MYDSHTSSRHFPITRELQRASSGFRRTANRPWLQCSELALRPQNLSDAIAEHLWASVKCWALSSSVRQQVTELAVSTSRYKSNQHDACKVHFLSLACLPLRSAAALCSFRSATNWSTIDALRWALRRSSTVKISSGTSSSNHHSI